MKKRYEFVPGDEITIAPGYHRPRLGQAWAQMAEALRTSVRRYRRRACAYRRIFKP